MTTCLYGMAHKANRRCLDEREVQEIDALGNRAGAFALPQMPLYFT